MIVLDVQNIAMRHGNNKSFNCKGIKIVIDYWQAKGHEVIGFLPDYVMQRRRIEQRKDLEGENIDKRRSKS